MSKIIVLEVLYFSTYTVVRVRYHLLSIKLYIGFYFSYNWYCIEIMS